jgi:hypothetical protein
MPAQHFGYYDDWRTQPLTCPKCGWTGTFEQGSVEHHEALMDSSCPSCSWQHAPMLAIVRFPTMVETEANIDRLSDEEKAYYLERKRFLARLEETSLKSPDDLPELSVSEIRLSWDFQEDEDQESWTILRHGDQIVWQELAVYEGAERFVEVLEILKRKYGERLIDVVPTDASEVFLYGDRLRSPGMVENARSQLALTQGPDVQNA